MTPPGKVKRRTPELFLNRELSWLEFNGRVLEEAQDPTNPLLERLKFATIVSSNLDEFFMVRAAGLRHRLDEGDTAPDPSGLTPSQQLTQISLKAHDMGEALTRAVHQEILPGLVPHGVRLVPFGALEGEEQQAVVRVFRLQFLPSLTPLAIDASRPFPTLANLSVNLSLLVGPREPGEERLGVVQVPPRLPRLVRVPGTEGACFVLLEELIRAELPALFEGREILESAVFRVTRDAEMELDEEGADFLASLEEELRKRRRSRVVRLEVEAGAHPRLVETLVARLEVPHGDVYERPLPVDVRSLAALLDLPGLDELRDRPLRPLPVPEIPAGRSIFSVLEEKDVLVHHPYDSFDPVVALASEAADDPDVLAIKQTLYRTSGDSPVVRSLARAADRGKQVTVLVELLARFDEDSNILWAHSLEDAGAHVIYGIRGYKTHSKILLVVRRTARGILRYVHLGTGNYNDRTARMYTDFGLMTTDPAIGEDASAFFNALTGYADPPRMKKLVMAPTRLRERFLELIRREQRRAEAGQVAEIRAKMNSLVDEDLIRALYEASLAGVKIHLNVRGICCLRPGARGISHDIEVVSVVDRFLEHSRVFYFLNGGDEEVYLSSADWMPRNLDRRIELLFPVEAPEARRRVLQALDAMFRDNVKARELQPDGAYRRRRPGRGEEPYRAQIQLHREAERERDRLRAAAGLVLEPGKPPPRIS